MVDQIFLSPKVKRGLITSNKHGIYQLPSDLLGLRILGNQEIAGKFKKFIELYNLVLSLPPKMNIFSMLVKIS